MNKIGAVLIVSLTVTIAFSGCKKDDQPVVDLGYAYFPVSVGSWIIYEVDSLWRNDDLAILDSINYLMLERVTEEYTDDEGRPAHRIQRFIKNELGEWEVRDVWTGTRGNTAAERTEENKRRLKLSFPTRNSVTWDMNVYNTDNLLDVKYESVDMPYTLNGFVFDSTLVVRNKLGPNAVEKRNFVETYAKHVGMIEKYWEETNTQVQFPTNGPPVVRVNGFRMNLKMIDFGHD